MNAGVYGLTSQTARDTHALLGRRVGIPSIDHGYHIEALDWWGRVLENRGAVSHATLLAVSRFCAFVEQSGIRDLFYRLNLFCGDNLSAALVPLYRGPRMALALGNAIDTNFNFVSADYTEAGGLNAGASNASKHLRTGLSPNAVGTRNGHLSAYISLPNAMAATQYHVLSVLNTSLERYFFYCNRAAVAYNPGEQCNWGLNVSANIGPGTFTGGHIVFSQDGDSGLASAVANERTIVWTNASTREPLPATRDFWVFAANNGGSPLFYLNQILRAYSIGKAMTPQQAAAYSIAMRDFQASLGRVA